MILGNALRRLRPVALPAAALLACAPLMSVPALAAPSGDEVVINEAYLSGGSAGAAYTHKFVELYNPTDQPVDLTGWSLQYRSATGTGASNGIVELSGTIAPGEYYLVSGGSNGTAGEALPEADTVAGGALNPSGTRGTLILSDSSERLTLAPGSITEGTDGVVDLLGYGSTNTFETRAAGAPSSNTDVRSLNRTDGVDTDDNSADFSLSSSITPTSGDGSDAQEPAPEDPAPEDPAPEDPAPEDPAPENPAPEQPEPGADLPIREIQGTGETTPYAGKQVTTSGVVTAVYVTGGLNGFYLQTAGTGGDLPEDHNASDGIFIYAPQAKDSVKIGDHVRVTGNASEYYGQTQITVQPANLSVLDEPAEAVKPAAVAWPEDDAEREALEGMLLQPTGEFTVTNNYDLNRYGEVGLATGDTPLRTPTDVAPVGTDEHQAVVADNAARGVILDDGSTWDYNRLDQYGSEPLPYISQEQPVRIGSSVTFTQGAVLGYGHDAWRLQPVGQVTGADDTDIPVTFENDRPEFAAPAEVGGDYTIGTFNVLNYFTSLGEDESGCRPYTDREGNPTTTNYCNVRGAYDQDSFAQQQEKIVTAINGMDTSVVALEEIENSAAFGQDRDAALAALVDALNAEAGAGTWAYVPSPSALPSEEDVIRTGFIYQPAQVEPIGESAILNDEENFDNAREPLVQEFRPVGGTEADDFVIAANHLKSKGSGSSATGDNVDSGQGAWNGDRTRQAEAMRVFTEEYAKVADTDRIFLVGDFNSYTFEDPMLGLYEAGYVNVAPEGQYSYSFDGQSGSLDHVLASPAAAEAVTGSDIWEINANEQIGFEYSRANYNVTDLYAPDQFRASDHNPAIVGLSLVGGADEEPAPEQPEPEQPAPGKPGEDTDPGRGEHPGKGKGHAKGRPPHAGIPGRPDHADHKGRPDHAGTPGRPAHAGR